MIQYNPPIGVALNDPNHAEAYYIWLEAQIGMVQQSNLDILRTALMDFQNHLNDRLSVTAKAQVYCVFEVCAAGSTAEGDYSTPHGDSEMSDISARVQKAVAAIDPTNQQLLYWMSAYSTPFIWGQSEDYSIWNLAINKNNILDSFSSSATVPFDQRWGLTTATTTANLEYPVLAQELAQLLVYRDSLVTQAQTACVPGGCDLNSPDVQALNTKTLDQAIQTYATRLNSDLGNSPLVTSDIKSSVLAKLQEDWITTDQPSISSNTTADTEILGDGVKRISKWSSVPSDSEAQRWGRQ